MRRTRRAPGEPRSRGPPNPPDVDWLPRRGVAQSGSAPVWGTGGRRFKSGRPDQILRTKPPFGPVLGLAVATGRGIAGIGTSASDIIPVPIATVPDPACHSVLVSLTQRRACTLTRLTSGGVATGLRPQT